MQINYSYTGGSNCRIRFQQRTGGASSLSLANLSKGFRNNGISQATVKKIRRAVSILNYFSEEKTFADKFGEVKTARVSFLTLTLPSRQRHTDAFCTANLLGGFLNLCRKKNILRNYVWRAEKQKNGNIHYHIITDEIVSTAMIYRTWNLQMEKFRYLQEYSEKFRAMDFHDYCRQPNPQNASREKLLYRFNKGKKSNWTRPNDTDVKFISSIDGVEKYLSKYLSKDTQSENIVRGRVWACSASISDGVEILYKDKDFNAMAFNLAKDVLKKPFEEFDFYTMIKINFSSLIAWFPWLFADIKAKVLQVFTPVEHQLQLIL